MAKYRNTYLDAKEEWTVCFQIFYCDLLQKLILIGALVEEISTHQERIYTQASTVLTDMTILRSSMSSISVRSTV